MLDALIMERYGVPAAAVLTEPFVPSGKAMALAQGFADYPFAVISHPINVVDKEVLQLRSEKVVAEVASLLMT